MKFKLWYYKSIDNKFYKEGGIVLGCSSVNNTHNEGIIVSYIGDISNFESYLEERTFSNGWSSLGRRFY